MHVCIHAYYVDMHTLYIVMHMYICICIYICMHIQIEDPCLPEAKALSAEARTLRARAQVERGGVGIDSISALCVAGIRGVMHSDI